MDFHSVQRRVFGSDRVNKIIPFASRDELFMARPRLSHLAANFSAWRDYGKLDRSQLKKIGVFALPRGGSNLICGHLHYHPNLFTIAERHKTHKIRLSYRLFLAYSIFGTAGLQNKRISDIRYLIFNKMNTSPSSEEWPPELVSAAEFKYVFIIRNPLRVVASQHHSAVNVSERPEWLYTPESFRLVVDMTVALLNMLMETRDIHPDRAILTLHERFCRDYEAQLQRLLTFIDHDLASMTLGDSPASFFAQTYCCGTRPVEQQGWLRCLKCGLRVRGHGEFNPLTPVSIERALDKPLDGFFSGDDIRYFQQALGPDLSAYWLDDHAHRYGDDLPEHAIEALRAKDGGWRRVVALSSLMVSRGSRAQKPSYQRRPVGRPIQR